MNLQSGPESQDGMRIQTLSKVCRKSGNLLFKGKYREAEELAQKNILGQKPENPAATYQALGDINIDFGTQHNLTNYRRELDIENAVASVSYTADQINFHREFFSSAVDQSLVIRLTADKSGSVSFTLRLSRKGNKAAIVSAGNEIDMNEHIGDGKGVKMYSRLKLINDGGRTTSGGDSIKVEKANSVTIYLTAATDYFGKDPSAITKTQMTAIEKQPYDNIRKNHITDYQSLFKRVDIDLGSGYGNFFPTDSRIAAMQNGYNDPDLIELYYQFGRYLLISSSRPGGLPANLQGIWADGMNPPWSADYHININIQMNYWPSEATNLGELQIPFIDFIDALRPNARRTAREVYGMKRNSCTLYNGSMALYRTYRGNKLWNVADGNCLELSEYLGSFSVWRRQGLSQNEVISYYERSSRVLYGLAGKKSENRIPCFRSFYFT